MGAAAADLAELCATVSALLRSGRVLADEKLAAVLPDEATLRDFLVPLLEWCRKRRPGNGRGLVGIAAPAGAGKSLLGAWLAATARAMRWPEFQFMSQDGYHLPNTALDGRTGIGPEGHTMPLRQLKGTPETFDAPKLLADLRALKSGRDEVLLPVYSRVLHDPVPGRIRVGPEVEWVFVEGNFLFLDVPPWRDIRDLLDRKVYLDTEDDILLRRLSRRHLAAGRTKEWVEDHLRRTDGPNIRLIRTSARFADVTFTWDRDGKLGKEHL
jgi:pantothenate kinase